MKIDFNVFSEVLRTKLKDKMGEELEIQLTEVTKNNGQLYHGFIMRTKECNIAPTIYIDKYYAEFKNDLKTYDEIRDEICEIYDNNRALSNIDVDELLSFENVKDKVICELINYAQNKELLKTVPYIPYHDLAIVFRILCTLDSRETGTILITHAHKAMWDNITEEKLCEIALKNTFRILGCRINSITDILKEHYKDMDEDVLEEMFTGEIPMYVMTNQYSFKGAAALLNMELMEQFSLAHNSDFYILPSSVHELILLPVDNCDNKDNLREMVSQINQSEVSVEDRLSNHIYYYALGSKKISMIA